MVEAVSPVDGLRGDHRPVERLFTSSASAAAVSRSRRPCAMLATTNLAGSLSPAAASAGVGSKRETAAGMPARPVPPTTSSKLLCQGRGSRSSARGHRPPRALLDQVEHPSHVVVVDVAYGDELQLEGVGAPTRARSSSSLGRSVRL